jgi:hypothetical protein
VDALNPEGLPREGLKITAALTHIGGAAEAPFPLSEVSPGRYHGSFTLDRVGEFNLRVATEQASAEAPLFVAYPALHEFTRADPSYLAALAAATGGRVLASEEQIFTGVQSRWVARAAWQAWVLAAFALFLADLIVRYASGLIGVRRRSAT